MSVERMRGGSGEHPGQAAPGASADDRTRRQPYRAPRLQRFGKLTELTLGGNPAGMNDPGGPSSGKL